MYYHQLLNHHKGRSICSYNNITSNQRLRLISLSSLSSLSAIVDSFSTTTKRTRRSTTTGSRNTIPGTSTGTSSRRVLLVPESKKQQQQQQKQSLVSTRWHDYHYYQQQDDEIILSFSSLLLLPRTHSSLRRIQSLSSNYPSSSLYYQTSHCYAANPIRLNHQWCSLSGTCTGRIATGTSTTTVSNLPVYNTTQMYNFSQNAYNNYDSNNGVGPNSITSSNANANANANTNTTSDQEYYIIQKSYDILDQSLIPIGVMTDNQFQEEMYNIVLYWCNRVQASVEKLKVVALSSTTSTGIGSTGSTSNITSNTIVINYNDELYTDTLVSFHLLMSLLNRIKLELKDCDRRSRQFIEITNVSESLIQKYNVNTMTNFWLLSTTTGTTNTNTNTNTNSYSTTTNNNKFDTIFMTIIQQWVSLYDISLIILPTLSKDNTIFHYKQLSIQTPNEMYEYSKRISDNTITTTTTTKTTPATATTITATSTAASNISSQSSSIQDKSIRINRDIILLLLRAVVRIDRPLLSQSLQLQENASLYNDDPVFIRNVLIDTINSFNKHEDFRHKKYYKISEIYSLILHSWIHSNHIDRSEQIVSLFSKIVVSYKNKQLLLDTRMQIDQKKLENQNLNQKQQQNKKFDLYFNNLTIKDITTSITAILNDCLHQLLTKPKTTTTVPTKYTITDNFDNNINIAVQLFELVLNIIPGAITDESFDIILWALLQKGSYETFLSSPAVTTSATQSTQGFNFFSSSVTAPTTVSFLSPYLNSNNINNNNNNSTDDRNTLSTTIGSKVRSRLKSLHTDELKFRSMSVRRKRDRRILPDNMIVPYLQNIHQMYSRAFDFIKVVSVKMKGKPNNDINSLCSYTTSTTFAAEMDGRVIRLLIENLAYPYQFVRKQNLSSTNDTYAIGNAGAGSNRIAENNYTNGSDLVVNDISSKQLNTFNLKKEKEIIQQLQNLSCTMFYFFLDLHRRTNVPQYMPVSRIADVIYDIYIQNDYKNIDEIYMKYYRGALIFHQNRFDEIVKLSLSTSTSTSSLSKFGCNQEGYNNFVSNIDKASTTLEQICEISLKKGVLYYPNSVLRPVFQKCVLFCRNIPVTATYTISKNDAIVDLLNISKDQTIHPSIKVLYSLFDNLIEKKLAVQNVSTKDANNVQSIVQSVFDLPYYDYNELKPTIREYTVFVLLLSKYKLRRECWKLLDRDILKSDHTNGLNQLQSSKLGNSSTMTIDHLNETIDSNETIAHSNNTIDSALIFYDTFINCVVLKSKNVLHAAMRLFTSITFNDINNFGATNETNNSNQLQFQKRTRYVIIALLRVLLESNDDSTKIMFATLKIYKTISGGVSYQPKPNRKQVVVQQQNNPSDVDDDDEDSKRIDMQQINELIFQLISKHKSNTMLTANKEDLDKLLQDISDVKRVI